MAEQPLDLGENVIPPLREIPFIHLVMAYHHLKGHPEVMFHILSLSTDNYGRTEK